MYPYSGESNGKNMESEKETAIASVLLHGMWSNKSSHGFGASSYAHLRNKRIGSELSQGTCKLV